MSSSSSQPAAALSAQSLSSSPRDELELTRGRGGWVQLQSSAEAGVIYRSSYLFEVLDRRARRIGGRNFADCSRMGELLHFEKSRPILALLLILCCLSSPKEVEGQITGAPLAAPAAPGSLVPAIFLFGDSLVDVGNNNYIGSLAKANFYPNGIDFPGGATGRFCNGKTVFDFICENLGLPYPPPYLAPTTNGVNILRGVNYASGAGGILDSTGSLYLQRLSLNQQLQNFQNNIVQLDVLQGPVSAANLLNSALYGVVIGSNDYINNYLQTTNSPTKNMYTPQAYENYLITTYSQQLTTLYTLGARKVVVANVGPLGCIPDQMSMVTTDVLGTCIPGVNDLVVGFNSALRTMVDNLNSLLPGSRFVYSNAYDSVMGLITTPEEQGFSVPNQGCCGLGRLNGQFPCLPNASLCQARSSYVFWDPFHPTEATNRVLATRLWSGGLSEVSPVNVQQLVTT